MSSTVIAVDARQWVRVALFLVLSAALGACGNDRSTPADAAPPSPVAAAVSKDLGIDWFEGGVEAAFGAAKREHKPVFLYWGAQWCPYCKQVEATVFTRRDVIERTRQFIAVELDGDAPAAQRAGERFGVMGYPTMIVFRPDGTEITRIPNGLNLEAYAEIFDLAMNALRPVADVLGAALAGEHLSDAEWQQLAVYSWGQDNQRALGGRDERETFAALANVCPATAGAACTRLRLNHLDAAIDAAAEAPLDSATKAAALGTLTRLLADDAQVAANLDAVLHAGPEFVAAVTEAGSPERAALAGRWQAVMLSLADDPRLSTVEQFYASYAPIGFLKLADENAAVPAALQTAIRARVDEAMAATIDPVERHAVVTTAASLLRAADLGVEALTLLEAELANSAQPFYLMSSLASAAERDGDTDTALAWRQRAYETATGESTRFRWGYGYVSSLIRLAPDAHVPIEAVTARLFEELSDPATAFFGGTQSRAVQLSDKLLAWADTADRAAVIERLRTRIAAVCSSIPAGETSRARCDGFLRPPPAG